MKARTSKGFSLIEVVIAMAIMSTSAMLLYAAWSGNHVRVQKMTINNKAALLLDQIIAELEIEYAQRLTQLPESDQGVFEDHPGYSWKMETKDFEMPDLRSILVSSDQGQEALLMIIDKLTEYLNESIKEMKVTVTYKVGKASVNYSATTFLVDYDRPLPIAAPGGG